MFKILTVRYFKLQLVDFESWKTILERSERNSGSVGSQGAVCVLRNSIEARYLDTEGNIYAFGVLLLEIVSGRSPYCKDKGYLVDWVWNFSKFCSISRIVFFSPNSDNLKSSYCHLVVKFGCSYLCRLSTFLKIQKKCHLWWIPN